MRHNPPAERALTTDETFKLQCPSSEMRGSKNFFHFTDEKDSFGVTELITQCSQNV